MPKLRRVQFGRNVVEPTGTPIMKFSDDGTCLVVTIPIKSKEVEVYHTDLSEGYTARDFHATDNILEDIKIEFTSITPISTRVNIFATAGGKIPGTGS